MKKKCKDFKGNEFNSIKDMCKYWGISISLYYSRINSGWKLKDILTIPSKKSKNSKLSSKKCTDFKGNEFNSIKDMCDYYNISYDLYRSRIWRGWSQQDALSLVVYDRSSCVLKYEDHLGNKFPTIKSMCKHWGIKVTTYNGRIACGWSKEKALTFKEKIVGKNKCKECTDYLGNKYSSFTEMCNKYGIKYDTYLNRLHKGWSQKDALTKKTKKYKKK